MAYTDLVFDEEIVKQEFSLKTGPQIEVENLINQGLKNSCRYSVYVQLIKPMLQLRQKIMHEDGEFIRVALIQLERELMEKYLKELERDNG